MFKRVGRPRNLDSLLPTKDMDSMQSYEEDLSTEECETDNGEFSFHLQAQNSSGEKIWLELLHHHHHHPLLLLHCLMCRHPHLQKQNQIVMMIIMYGEADLCVTVMKSLEMTTC